MQTDDPVAVAYIVVKALLAMMVWGAAVIGFFMVRLNWAERIWAAVAAGMFIMALPITDEVGFAMTLALFGWQWLKLRRTAAAGAAP